MKRAHAGVPSGEAGVLMRRAGRGRCRGAHAEGGGGGGAGVPMLRAGEGEGEVQGLPALSGYGSSNRAQSCVAGAELMCHAAQIHPDIETLHGKPHLCQPPTPPPPPTRFTSLPVAEVRLAWPPAPLSQR